MWEATFARGALIVHHPGGVDAKWDQTTKRALTYCISDEFGVNKDAMITAMAAAKAGWETFANLDFTHVAGEDASCTETNPNVLFDIRPVSGQPDLARAFFPGEPREARNVLVDLACTCSPPTSGSTTPATRSRSVTPGASLATASYGNAANHDVSVTRATTLDASAALVRHTTMSTLPASPGRRVDGAAY